MGSVPVLPQDGFVEALQAAAAACRTLPPLVEIPTARGQAEAVFTACLEAARLAGTLHPGHRRLVDAANLVRRWCLNARRAAGNDTAEQAVHDEHPQFAAQLAQLADEIDESEPHP